MKQVTTFLQCVITAEEVACYMGGRGKQGLETSEESLAAGEGVAVSQNRY